MFSASSSPALPVTLGHGYAAAMRQTSTTSAVGHSLSRIVAVGATAVALGVSAVLGGSLLYVSLHRAESAASEAGTGPLRICSCDNEEEDDAFATGKGAENLFDEEKVKARQKLPRGKAKGAAHSHASTATITAGAGAAAATVSAALRKLAGSAPPVSDAKEALTMLANTEEIREREQYIKLVRALLQREAGIAYDDDDDSSTSSDSTDVSLNYHLATAMEGNARDELLMAFSAYGDFSDSAVYGSSIPDAGDENAADLQLSIMIKTLEYLDMSNEREKLRSRRIAMYREAGHATPVSSIDAAGSDRDGGELDEGGDVVVDPMHFQLAAHYAATHYGLTRPMDERDDDEGDGGDYPSAMERQAQRFQSMLLRPSKMNMPAEDRMNSDDSVLDRILGEGPAQADNAQHFYSREEMRRARRDPASDIRIRDFERELFSRIRHLAKSFALTDAMAEREVSEEDARKRVAREQRRQQGIHSSAKAAVDPNPAAAADDLAEGTEEWEDEADWEDA
ncbi:hypothetical protein CGC20_25690 [Leishmania donovani]|uniref:Uncharacterized protein n=1 Tax=Leishmania donovani TaxID=5661 RepID=A0A504XSS8_LEIDO|nr:hypothetical protein CGC20_25690 [Leishmania donovani]